MNSDDITPAPLLEMVYGAWAAKTVTVATELGIFTIAAQKGSLSVEEVAEELNIATRPAEMLLNACVSLELLARDGVSYMNTPITDEFLVKDKPSYFGDMIILTGVRDYHVWGDLKKAVLTNRPVRPDIEALTSTRETARPFTEAMHNVAIAPAIALSDLIDFSKFKCLLDLGAGSGAYSIMVAKKYPNLKVILFDFPHVCEVADEFVRELGASADVTTYAGDFTTDELPEGADVVLLGNVLPHRNEEKNRILLQKVYDYLPTGGMLIIVELLLDEDKSGPLSATLFGLHMLMVSQDGRTYTEKEVRQWLRDSGFADPRSQVPLSGRHSAIYAMKK